MLTLEDYKKLCKCYKVSLKEDDMIADVKLCNDQHNVPYNDYNGNPLPLRTAEEWAHVYLKQEGKTLHLN